MYEIPTTIELSGEVFNIRRRGDFRMVLDCFNAMNDIEMSKKERMLTSLIIFYDGMEDVSDLDRLPDLEEAANKMIKFFNCGEDESPGTKVNQKLIDWDKDSQLICSAVNNVAHTEIRELSYLHWWTFMGYYLSVGESSLSTVVGIRNKIAKGKKLEKYEKEFKNNNPQYFNLDTRTLEQKQNDELVKQIWNSGK